MFLSLACHNAEFTSLRGHLPTALEDTNTEHRLAIMQFIIRSNDCRIADSLTRHNAFYQDILRHTDMLVTCEFSYHREHAIDRLRRSIKDLKDHPCLFTTSQHTIAAGVNQVRMTDLQS